MFGRKRRKIADTMLKMTKAVANASLMSLPAKHPAYDLISRDEANTGFYVVVAAFAFVWSATPEHATSRSSTKRLRATLNHWDRRAWEQFNELDQWALLQEEKGINAYRAAGMWVMKHLRYDSATWDRELSKEEDDLAAELSKALQVHLEYSINEIEKRVGLVWGDL